jgi:hypothetical protein
MRWHSAEGDVSPVSLRPPAIARLARKPHGVYSIVTAVRSTRIWRTGYVQVGRQIGSYHEGSSLGLAMAQRFTKEGAFVYIVGRRQNELDMATALIGQRVATVQGDVQNAREAAPPAGLSAVAFIRSIARKEASLLSLFHATN